MVDTNSTYPTTKDTFEDPEDGKDVYEADYLVKIHNVLEAIQDALGTSIEGSQADLVTRLSKCIADDGSIAHGTSFPASPVANQIFTRTDEDKQYRRNAANTQWLEVASGGHTLISTIPFSADSDSGNITIEPDRFYLLKGYLKAYSPTNDGILWMQFNASSSSAYDCEKNDIEIGSGGGGLGTEVHSSDTKIDLMTNGAEIDKDNGDVYIHMEIFTFDNGTVDAVVKGYIIYDNSTTNDMHKCEFSAIWDGGAVSSFKIYDSASGSPLCTYTGELFLYEYAVD